MKILKSIGLYFVLPVLFILLGILLHIVYLEFFYPNKYNPPEETSFLTEESKAVVSSSESNIAKTDFTEEESGYYLTVVKGKIVVMEMDQKTIYLTTDIYAEALSDSLKEELMQGKFINSIEELYGFLESYTS